MSPGAISAAGPVQMKENSSFSFRIAHHRLVLRPQTSFPGGLGIPGDERYVRELLHFSSLSAPYSLIAPGDILVGFRPNGIKFSSNTPLINKLRASHGD